MRIRIGATALLLGLLLAAPCWAQRTLTFGGVNPAQIQNVPVVTSNVATPTSQPIAAPQLMSNTSFRLSSFIPKLTFPSAGPVFGQSQFPTQQNLPGKNWLKSFGYTRPGPVQ